MQEISHSINQYINAQSASMLKNSWIYGADTEEILYMISTAEKQIAVEIMKNVMERSPHVANEVLCHYYDIAVYKIGDTCFSPEVRPQERDMWMVCPVAGAFPAEIVAENGVTEKHAYENAVKAFGLMEKFIGNSH